MTRRPAITRDFADSLAIAALVFLAADSERLSRFLALTGIESGSLRSAAQEPNFLSGVLDYLLGDEPLLTAFAAEHEIPPESVSGARAILASDQSATA